MTDARTDASTATDPSTDGLVLRPFRAVRPRADGPELAALLCPPYDVIDAPSRAALIGADERNAVSIVLPEGGDDRYDRAARLLADRVADGTYAVDESPALYVYEMRTPEGHVTRGLVGALQLRDPADGVVLPHENTMAGPVADRLALMRATEADVEPIYLVYDGGGAASRVVAAADERTPLAHCTTPDGVQHTLWAVTGTEDLDAVAEDLAARRAVIADGHHRYATYRALQQELREQRGEGPWDDGLTLLVDSTAHGPQVHAIHRFVTGLSVARAAELAVAAGATVTEAASPEDALDRLEQASGFAVGVTDGTRTVVVTDDAGTLRHAAQRPGEPGELSGLDITVLHRGLIETAWQLSDDEGTVGYAHDVADAVATAAQAGGCAVLVRPTPVAAVAAVAAAGARMPRKSTSFTPKPASGLLMRRFADA